ncbi:MAG: NUMOD3 domain-containing DNA-binding protein [Candidatus Nitrosotenuis sp.]
MLAPAHISKHKLNAAQYRELFPGAVLRIQSNSSKEKLSASKKGQKPYNVGKNISEEQKQKQSQTLKERYSNGTLIHWNTGRTRSLQTREKIRQSTKGQQLTHEQKVKHLASIRRYRNSDNYIPAMLGKHHSKETKEKLSKSVRKTWNKKTNNLIEECIKKAQDDNLTVLKIEHNYWFDFQCNACGTHFTFTRQIFRDSTKQGIELCPTCYPRLNGRSKMEIDFYCEIQKMWPTAIASDIKILGGKEIDVLIKEKKLGFEFAGIYHHSELKGNPKYHLLWKQQFAFKENHKIFTVFENEWVLKRDLVLSRIASILGVNQTFYDARKCNIVQITSQMKNKFLDDNHLQGRDTSSISLGLFYQDTLVSVMTFKKTNIVKGGTGKEWELSRFCNLKFCTVRGGAGKLLSYFQRNFNSERLLIISFANRRWSNGEFYEKIGFKFAGTTPPSYWYFKGNSIDIQHRSNFMKHKLLKKFGGDPNKTEWELAQENGFNRIWDCGNTKWMLI